MIDDDENRTEAFSFDGGYRSSAKIEMADAEYFFVTTKEHGRSEPVGLSQLIPVICRELNLDVSMFGEDASWSSGLWETGASAVAIASALRAAGASEIFTLDDEDWLVGQAYPRPMQLEYSLAVLDVLAAPPSTTESQAKAEDAHRHVLLKLGRVYRIVTTDDGEVIGERPLDVTSDGEAVESFRNLYAKAFAAKAETIRSWRPAEGELLIRHHVDNETQIWWMRLDSDEVVLDSPTGQTLTAPANISWDRDALEYLKELQPSALQIPAGATVTIESDSQVGRWLPLYLEPDSDEDPEQLTVNRTEWHVLGWPGTHRVVSPTRDPEPCWAWFGWSETASRTSGLDYSEIGPVTEAVTMITTFLDERSLRHSLAPTSDPARSIHEWLNENQLVHELRSCWPGGGNDPITRGFRALLHYGRESMTWGAPDLCPAEWSDDMVGTTSTSEWHFRLTSDEEIRHQLVATFGWADGDIPPPPSEPKVAPASSGDGDYAHLARKIQEALSVPHPQVDLERAQEAHQASQQSEERRMDERKRAADLLGLGLNASRVAIYKRVEELIEQDPGNSNAYWYAAYDLLPPLVSSEESLVQELRKCQARAMALEFQNKKVNWPMAWDERLAPLWIAVGGTAGSAATWAEAGWTPELILTDPNLPGFANSTIEERVTFVDGPPILNNFDSEASGIG